MKPSEIQKLFVITLDRRPERLAAFREEWSRAGFAEAGFRVVDAWRAVDGKTVPHPPWWIAGGGAWGCYRSHMQILEAALQNAWGTIAVFEDDATFKTGAAEAVARFLDRVPADAELIYLGGQHLHTKKHPPAVLREGLLRPYNVNRTHAMIWRPLGIHKAYRHLSRKDWTRGHHIDHHLGRLVQRQGVKCVAPDQWLVGQRAGRSDISGKTLGDRFWKRGEQRASEIAESPFVGVIGPHRSGTSCVAMLLYKLGVHMGNELGGFERTGGGEAKGLADLCEWAMPFPELAPVQDFDSITIRMRKWIHERKQEAQLRGTIAGGKYPHLCALLPHLYDVCGDTLRIVDVDRPLEDSIRSLQTRSREHPGKWWSASDAKCAELQTALDRRRRESLAALRGKVPTLRVPYYELLAEPRQWVQRICDFLDLVPLAQRFENAVAHVQPKLNRHGAKSCA